MATVGANSINIDPNVQRFIQSLDSELVPTIKQAVENKVDGEVTVKIVVVGASRSGKSLFIRKFLNYPTGDPRAPTYGRGEKDRTITLKEYERKEEMPGIVMYDAMGIGHGKFKKVSPERYCEMVQFEQYDIVIVMTSLEFASDELKLFQHAKKKNLPCFLLVSHFDEHIDDEMDKCGVSTGDAADNVRQAMTLTIKQELVKLNDKDGVKVYCIDSRNPNNHDFPNLQGDITSALSAEKRRLVEKRLFELSEEAVKKKAASWRKDLPVISITSGVAGLSPLPGTDLAVELAYISGFLVKFLRDFFLTEAKLNELCETFGVPVAAVPQIREKFKFIKFDTETVREMLTNATAVTRILSSFVKIGIPIAVLASDDLVKIVPVLGTLIGCSLGAVTGYFTTWYVLAKIVDGCEHDAMIAVSELRRLLAEQQHQT